MEEQRVRMRIAGMSCADCEHHVQVALEGVGAEEVKADFRRGEARFRLGAAKYQVDASGRGRTR